MNITVIWMNGQKEAYRCKDWRVENSLLWLDPEEVFGPAPKDPVRCIPLRNVQVWTVK